MLVQQRGEVDERDEELQSFDRNRIRRKFDRVLCLEAVRLVKILECVFR